MNDPYFFGYGSLVNRTTHDFSDPRRASLKGWRRAWRHTDRRPVAFLTAVPDARSEIEGMIAHVPGGNWADLDAREWAYDRVPATGQVTHGIDRAIDIAVYAVPHGAHMAPSARYPILLSYLDVVVQGFLNEYGTDGAARFFATTDGWDAPILNDRAEPRYPRHRVLRADQTDYVDETLDRIGARVISALP